MSWAASASRASDASSALAPLLLLLAAANSGYSVAATLAGGTPAWLSSSTCGGSLAGLSPVNSSALRSVSGSRRALVRGERHAAEGDCHDRQTTSRISSVARAHCLCD